MGQDWTQRWSCGWIRLDVDLNDLKWVGPSPDQNQHAQACCGSSLAQFEQRLGLQMVLGVVTVKHCCSKVSEAETGRIKGPRVGIRVKVRQDGAG